jgi:hypothetical protein
MWPNFQIIIELFAQKIVTKLSKVWIWDPGSEIRDPGVKKAPDPGSRIRIRNTAKNTVKLSCYVAMLQAGIFYVTLLLVIGTTSLFFAFDCPYMAEITPGRAPPQFSIFHRIFKNKCYRI